MYDLISVGSYQIMVDVAARVHVVTGECFWVRVSCTLCREAAHPVARIPGQWELIIA